MKGRKLRIDVLDLMMKQKHPKCKVNMKRIVKRIKHETGINPKDIRSCYEKTTFIRHVFDRIRYHVGTSAGDFDFNCVCRQRNRN